jgi:HSP20 family molecular chaperone IbpA
MSITEVLYPNDSLVSSRSFLVEKIQGGEQLTLALPGVDRDQLKVQVTKDGLRITVSELADMTLLTRRCFLFTHKVDSPKVSAKMKNGLLVVQVKSFYLSQIDVVIE